ncbi:DNA methyltransferase [Akkermansia muciniphila]|uniref:DNA methyltransferase n=1 Tax=Akkermansia muciniphila TaxID=239935 RepID=UPI000B8E652E|nr:DNA methyltransferase [Akkermansia muciniphila]
MDDYLTIGQAANILGVNQETLRRWDNTGKFTSLRHPINNYRVYSQAQVFRLAETLQLEYGSSFSKKKFDMKFSPCFETKYGELYNEDANNILASIESNSIDLIFADPPYNIKKAKWDYFSSQNDYLNWCLIWIKESQRILTETGSLYICGFSEILAEIKHVAAPYFKSCKWLIWFYRNKANLGNDWGRSHESILHLRKSNNIIFNIDEVRIPYNEHTVKYPRRTQALSSNFSGSNKKNYQWEPNPLGAKPKDVFEIPTISNGSWEKYQHETQKPVELLRKIILSSSNIQSRILDPFGGSGTTYAVAEAYGRKWIGIEKDLNYCEIIKSRLSDNLHLKRIASCRDEEASRGRRKKLR